MSEFHGDVSERVVLAYVSKAAEDVRYFGEDPAAHPDWVAGITCNELALLAGRDVERAGT